MSYCKNCGAELEEGQKFCKECGKAVNEEVKVENNDTIMGILSYISILVLIPLVTLKDSKFVKFHANQGLVLFIFELVNIALIKIFSFIPLLGWLINIALYLVSIALFVFSILGIVHVIDHDEKEIPIIGGINILK